MELHKPLLEAVLTALQKIILENYYSDKVLEYLFKSNKKLGKRDRQFIAETTYDIVRYYYYYAYLSNSNDLEDILSTYLNEKYNNLIPSTNFSDIPDRIKLSFNKELWAEAEQQIGKEKWLLEANALNQPAPLVIRTNTLKITRDDLQQKLASIGIETIVNSEVPESLIISNKKYLSQNDFFKQGLYEFQDLSSQKVAHFIPGEILARARRIVDACAGAGGKTLHLSALMNNKGQIIAMDVDEKKLKELRKRARRAGCFNIQTKVIENSKIIKRLQNSADILLIDAPCSGTGVIKRNPDIKLKFTQEGLDKLISLQRKILSEYSTMTKPQGYMLYVTCSIFPKENEEQINFFLNHNLNFELIKQQTIYPSYGYDGFYMALLKRDK